MDVAATLAYLKSLESKIKTNFQITLSDEDADFGFQNASCYICNGYYGSNFGQPVCLTCHAFLFPEYAHGHSTSYTSSEKTDDSDSGNDEPPDLNYILSNAAQNNVYYADRAADNNVDEEIPNDNVPKFKDAISTYHLPNIQHRLELLSTAQPPDQVESGLVQRLPPEVLLWIFSYLDDLSLCSISMVCRQWTDILKTYVSNQSWYKYVCRRWPLYRPLVDNKDWFKVYQHLMTSCFCYTCLVQMSVHSQPIGEENSWRRHRLRNELKLMHNDPPEGIMAVPLDHKYCHWQATIKGPKGSPYEGGLFYLYIQVPYSYPLEPPVVRFLTKILHPNVSRHGDVGIDSIHHNWSLVLTISKVLISIQSLLTDPYVNICMEPSLGKLYVNDHKKFEAVARKWTWKYAMHDCSLD